MWYWFCVNDLDLYFMLSILVSFLFQSKIDSSYDSMFTRYLIIIILLGFWFYYDASFFRHFLYNFSFFSYQKIMIFVLLGLVPRIHCLLGNIKQNPIEYWDIKNGVCGLSWKQPKSSSREESRRYRRKLWVKNGTLEFIRTLMQEPVWNIN